MRGKPTRVYIQFTKTDGTTAHTWESAPNRWARMSPKERESWANQAARGRHPGAKDATVQKVEHPDKQR